MMNGESSSNGWKCSSQDRMVAVFALIAALSLTACGGVPKTYYYTLQTPAVPAPSEPRTAYVLGVEHFRSSQMLRDDRIVYYVSPTELNFYQHHRWGAEPATLLSEFTAHWLEASGVFAQVKMFPVRDRVDYTLGGEVRNFEEVDSGGGVKVRMALALSLVRSRDHKLVWSGHQREEAVVQRSGVEGVAEALSASCAQALREMTPGLIAQVAQDFKSSGK